MKKSNIIIVYEWGCIEPSIVGYAFDFDQAKKLALDACIEHDYKPDRDQILWVNIENNETGYFNPEDLGYDNPN